VAVTGVAGPSGGTTEKPVGLVHLAAIRRNASARHDKHRFPDNGRSSIRLAAATEALLLLLSLIADEPA
jgi:nicotinamide-nucleotide amidase